MKMTKMEDEDVKDDVGTMKMRTPARDVKHTVLELSRTCRGLEKKDDDDGKKMTKTL